MTGQKEKLLYKALCYSLPYDLRIKDKFGNIYILNGEFLNHFITSEKKGFLPIYRSLDKLTQEIEHNGERFVPLEKLCTMIQTNQFCNDINLKLKRYIKYLRTESKLFRFSNDVNHEVEFIQKTSNIGDLNIVFGYSEGLRRFYEYDRTRNITHATAFQFELFQKLLEWNFNLFLPKGFYIEKV